MHLESKDTRAVLMAGMTHYVDIGAPKDAVMTYIADGRAHIRLPDGKIMHGKWEMTDSGYAVEWTDGPSANWSFDYEPGRICYVDAQGNNQGPITRIVPGDPEQLAG